MPSCCSTSGPVPGPKLGTFTPIRTGVRLSSDPPSWKRVLPAFEPMSRGSAGISCRMAESPDATDWSILIELQRDGRIPLTELGRRVNLSASATTERVRRLEATGVITGYRAEIDLAKVGLPVLAVVRLKYPGSQHQPLHRMLEDRSEILECLRTTGDDCYTLKVAAPPWRTSSSSSTNWPGSAAPQPTSSTARHCPTAAPKDP